MNNTVLVEARISDRFANYGLEAFFDVNDLDYEKREPHKLRKEIYVV